MNKERHFEIMANNFCWIDNSKDNPEDLCLHGDISVKIEDELLSYSSCVSASALRMLKTLTENHEITNTGEQMLPCCGHSLFANATLDTVNISGCDNGIDYSVRHENGNIVILTETGNVYIISLNEYKNEVIKFARLVEGFYDESSQKILPFEEWERNGYIAFWKEWKRRISECNL